MSTTTKKLKGLMSGDISVSREIPYVTSYNVDVGTQGVLLTVASGSGYGNLSFLAKSSTVPALDWNIEIRDTQMYYKGQAIDGVVMTSENNANHSRNAAYSLALGAQVKTVVDPTNNITRQALVIVVPSTSLDDANTQGSAMKDWNKVEFSFSGKAENLFITQEPEDSGSPYYPQFNSGCGSGEPGMTATGSGLIQITVVP